MIRRGAAPPAPSAARPVSLLSAVRRLSPASRVALTVLLLGLPVAWTVADAYQRNHALEVRQRYGAELLPEFYRVFARNMRDLGTPVYSPRFFEAVVCALGPGSRVFVVRHESEPIAGSVTVSWRDRVEVPWASM